MKLFEEVLTVRAAPRGSIRQHFRWDRKEIAMMTNIEDYREEFEAEEAAKAEAARKAQEAKEEAERLAQQKQAAAALTALIKNRYPIRKAIVDAAIVQGATASTTEDDPKLLIEGVDCSFWISIDAEYTRFSSWRSKPNGKLRMAVGSYGERQSYPQKKDGSFNWPAIAAILINKARAKNAEAKAEAARRKNSNAAAALAREFNLPQYSALISPAATEDEKVFIKFSEINGRAMTKDDARKVLQALRACGVKLSYNDK